MRTLSWIVKYVLIILKPDNSRLEDFESERKSPKSIIHENIEIGSCGKEIEGEENGIYLRANFDFVESVDIRNSGYWGISQS